MFKSEPNARPGSTVIPPQWYNPTVNDARISAQYGQKPSNPDTTWKAYGVHTGVDYGVKSGSPAYAVSNGRVTKSGFDKGIGNFVTIQVSPGKQVTYEHLNSVGVKNGQFVRGGSQLGSTGNTGSLSQGSHLHTEYTVNNKLVSPVSFYGKNTPSWVSQADKAPSVLGKSINYGNGAVNNINIDQKKLPIGDSGQLSTRTQSFSAGFNPTVISSPIA